MRVVNAANEQETLNKGEVLGVLEPVVRVSSAECAALATNNHTNPLSEVKLGDELTHQLKDELLKILGEYKSVFYTGGPLPLVRVGVEHSIRLDHGGCHHK